MNSVRKIKNALTNINKVPHAFASASKSVCLSSSLSDWFGLIEP